MDVHPGPEKRRVPDDRSAGPDLVPRVFHENEDWYQDLVEHSHDLLCIHDLQGRLLSVNPAPARMMGYSVEEMLRIPMREMIAPDFRAEFDDYLKDIERTGESRGLASVVTRSGERRVLEYHSTLRREGVETPIVRGMAHDVTAQKHSEKLLREASEELLSKVREGERTIQELKLFRNLLDQCNDAIEVVDPETLRFLDVNEKSCLELGYSREELLSMRVFDIAPGITEASTTKISEELQKSGSVVMESVHRRKDGTHFLVEVSLRWVQLDRGYVVVIARDLTERRRAEAQLQASENRYRAVHDRAPVGICRVETATGRLLGVNPKYCEIVGRTEQDLVGRTFQSITHPDDLGRNLEKLRQLEAGEVRHYQMEKKYLRPDGSVRWAEVRVAAMWPEGAAADWHMAIVQDITEREQTAERLREYERVVEGLEEMIAVVDREYRFVIANHAFLKHRLVEKERLIGRSVLDQMAEDGVNAATVELIKQKMDECFQGRVVRYEASYDYPSVGERDLSMSYFPIEGPAGIDRIACILRDVTERKRDEARLLEYERVVEDSEDMITVVDREYRYVIANRAYLNYKNMERGQLIGHLATEEAVDKEIFETVVRPKLDECFQGKVVQYEMKYSYPQRGERDLQVRYFPIAGAAGVDRIVSVLRDVTESKRAEESLKKSEEKFSKAFRQSPMVLTLSSTRNHHYIDVNETFERLTGWRREEVIGRTALDIGLWAPGEVDLAKLLLAEGCVRNVEARFRMRDGSIRIGLSTAELIEVNGEPCMLAVTADITERKQAEEALRRSEDNYRRFVAQSSEGIFREDPDTPIPVSLPEDELIHRILYDQSMAECNDAMAAMYGFTSGQELLGKRSTEMLVPDDPRNIELTREFIRSGFRVIDLESHEIDIHGNPKIFLNSMIGTVENGMLVRTWGIQRDITEKVKLEEARRQAEEELRGSVRQLCQVTEELRVAKEKLAEEKLYLEEAIDSELGFGEIIGRSDALKEVMQKVAKVAPSDATVLLLGETGTGKELVARALHRMSEREGKSFIKLNCAAIPSGLLESELFGHEKGAFTGAIARKLGRLELADKGTLFLDEIGEIPLSLQPKLLRVLQDMEFERLGSTQTLKVDFRLLAATNRDLLQSVKAREFRSDLYYRLNVFPILIPPLRERREDIRPLAEHFVRKFSQQMKKSITSIPARTMEMLVRWEWPGNIRELENFIERSVILSPGLVLMAPLTELQKAVDQGNVGKNDTLRDKERERILQALRDCGGKLGGPDGAAARLGLKRTTLQSKLDQFGIKPGMYRA